MPAKLNQSILIGSRLISEKEKLILGSNNMVTQLPLIGRVIEKTHQKLHAKVDLIMP
jgi:hypothetical protein